MNTSIRLVFTFLIVSGPGVQLATLSSMAPERKSDFAGVVFRAFISGSVACFLTACIAGTLYDQEDPDTLFQQSLGP